MPVYYAGKEKKVQGLPGSAEPSADIILCAFILRMGKDLLRITEFHHFSHKEKGEVVRDTGSLLHIVSDNVLNLPT